MKKFVLLMCSLMFVYILYGQEVNKITLGKTKIETQKELVKYNFKLITTTKSYDDYSGCLFTGETVTIRIYNTPITKKIWKICIIKHYHNWDEINEGFDYYNQILSSKYGLPIEVVSDFKLPYHYGDGREMSSMAKGMGKIVNTYTDLDDNRIYLEIIGNRVNRIELYIRYENKNCIDINQDEKNKIIYNTF